MTAVAEMKNYTNGDTSDNPFMFTGREWDRLGDSPEANEGTGLYYYRARYYSWELGRFISEDPIGLAGGINMYAYVGNNPLNFVDPLGLMDLGRAMTGMNIDDWVSDAIEREASRVADINEQNRKKACSALKNAEKYGWRAEKKEAVSEFLNSIQPEGNIISYLITVFAFGLGKDAEIDREWEDYYRAEYNRYNNMPPEKPNFRLPEPDLGSTQCSYCR